MRNNLSIFLLIFLLIIRLFSFFISTPTYKNGDTIRITAKVLSEPIRYEDSQYLKILALKIYLPLYPEISYGDEIVIEGQVEDQKLTESKLIEIIESKGILMSLRSRLISFFQRAFPEPHSALVAGIVLGAKQSIPADFWEALKYTGTAHVVVASGMNVTLVGGFILHFLVHFVKRKRAMLISLVVIWAYALLSGFDAPIVRATIMGSIGLVAILFGKLNKPIRPLIFSGFIMLFIKPQRATDLGFILSFAATLSLLLFQKKIEKHLKKVPTFFREGLSTSLAAQICVAPILFFAFGRFNIFSPIINALVLWTVPIITLIGFISGVCGLVSFETGKLIVYLAYPFTSYFTFIVKLFS